MGIRIEAYAVDLPRLDKFLNSGLVDLLIQYQRDGIDEGTKLVFTFAPSCDTYDAVPRGPLREFIADSGQGPEAITEERLRTIEALKCPAREHISGDTIYQAHWLFEGFSNCKGIDFIKRLTGGNRRWWIGSVLQTGQALLPIDEYKELEKLFRKILRGCDCGFSIVNGDAGFVAEGLPFVPDNDPDLRFGRWLEKECSIAMSLLSKIVDSSPAFKRPPEFAHSQMADSEWHEWAHSNVVSFLQMRDLDYGVCNMLSFIG